MLKPNKPQTQKKLFFSRLLYTTFSLLLFYSGTLISVSHLGTKKSYYFLKNGKKEALSLFYLGILPYLNASMITFRLEDQIQTFFSWNDNIRTKVAQGFAMIIAISNSFYLTRFFQKSVQSFNFCQTFSPIFKLTAANWLSFMLASIISKKGFGEGVIFLILLDILKEKKVEKRLLIKNLKNFVATFLVFIFIRQDYALVPVISPTELLLHSEGTAAAKKWILQHSLMEAGNMLSMPLSEALALLARILFILFNILHFFYSKKSPLLFLSCLLISLLINYHSVIRFLNSKKNMDRLFLKAQLKIISFLKKEEEDALFLKQTRLLAFANTLYLAIIFFLCHTLNCECSSFETSFGSRLLAVQSAYELQKRLAIF